MGALAREVMQVSRAHNGAIAAEELHRAGLSREAIRARVRRGRLVRAFYGVYVVGDPKLMPLALESAALLSRGEDAVLSHRSAAAVWGLAQPDPQVIDVTLIGAHRREREGVQLHRVKSLTDTTGTSELADAFGEARANRLITDAKLSAALKRTPRNHPGAAIVRRMLEEGGTYDRSRAETLMRKLCRQAGLPQPLTNIMLNGHLVDFYWPDQRLIVEVDGYGTHGNRLAFENDRRRDQTRVAAGYVVIRVTWRQLQHEAIAITARIAQALAHRRAA